MIPSPLKLHARLILAIGLVVSLSLMVTLSAGQLKPAPDIELFDIIGEGGIVLITLMWIYVTLISRPAGYVTNWLIVGLTGLHVSVLIDFLDEFLTYPDNYAWLTAVESLPAPLGMLLMSIGLYYWHQEQLTINEQLKGRERVYRQHNLADKITSLNSADYMVQQIQDELSRDEFHGFCLLMLDLDNFDKFVRRHGDLQGDRLLRELAGLVLMNLRTTDLVCRYAGDRYIVLLPDTGIKSAEQVANQIQQAVAHLAFKPEQSTEASYHNISISLCEAHQGDDVHSLLQAMNQNMELIKSAKAEGCAA